MTTSTFTTPLRPSAWATAVVFLIAFYVFLMLGTRPQLIADANGFWTRAQTFEQDGLWTGLRHSFDAREPCYSLLIYGVEKVVGASAAPRAVVGVQFGMLLACAAMAAWIVSRFKAGFWPMAAFLLVGLSPGLLNSSVSLYCETFAGFLFTGWMFTFFLMLDPARQHRRWGWGVASALLGGMLILTRATYLYVAVVTLAGWGVLFGWRTTPRKKFLLIGPLYAVLLLAGPLLWMARNEHVAGNFNLVNYGGFILTGRYQKSLETYSLRDVAAGTLNSVSESACRAVFGDCSRYYWEYAGILGYKERARVAAAEHLSAGESDRLIFKRTVHDIATKHPIRFIAFGWYELVQLIFFETLSTGASEVRSPLLLAITRSTLLRGLVHFVFSVLYLIGFIRLLWMLCFRPELYGSARLLILSAIIAVMSHFLIYSMATTVIRYSFVIAPVYIALSLVGWSIL